MRIEERIEKVGLIDKYRKIMRSAQWKVKPEAWIFISIITSCVGFLICFLAIGLLRLPVSQIVSFGVFLGLLDIMLGMPYLKATGRINQIEEALPDALKQIADTLKAGGTYEFALREVAMAQYGPLSKELKLVLAKLEEGENLENSLKGFSDNIESRLIKRSIAIIIDSIKAGAGLAEVLDEISDDVRELHRINVERKSQTILQVIFIAAAGVFVSPMIFGFVTTVISLFTEASVMLGVNEAEMAAMIDTKNFILLLMLIYLVIASIANSAMIALMREGKISKSIIYLP
ncbi:MAG: type II secretion system F family protein, partial [Candidatus Diapherotrites archaeon]|nr:type II secretion system F family protein [Candidatus Diapherotrites archaeon]